MKWFKRILIGVFILLVLIIGALFLLPTIFKDDIYQAFKDEINNNLNAKVDFGEFGISLWRSFPNLSFTVSDIDVQGLDEFEGMNLAKIGTFDLNVDIMSIIKGDQIKVKSIGIIDADLNLLVLSNGKANYDITIPSEEKEELDEETNFNLSLKDYYLKRVNLSYENRQVDLLLKLLNFNHEGQGDFTQDIVDLTTQTSCEAITYHDMGVDYLKQVEFYSECNLNLDLLKSKYTFNENTFKLNDFEIALDGWLGLNEMADIETEMSIATKTTSFKSLLSLIPTMYTRDFDKIQVDGDFKFASNFKGVYSEDKIPQFKIALDVPEANFKYPDLKSSVEQITIDLDIHNNTGNLDSTVINLKRLYANIATNPIDLKLITKTPFTDPYIIADIKSQMNLGSLKDVIPLEDGEEYKGSVTADIQCKGHISALEEERYEDFDARGNLILLGYEYEMEGYPTTIIEKAYMDFHPTSINVSSLNGTIGNSDFSAKGSIENYLPFFLADSQILAANLDVNSNYFDLDPFMAEDTTAVASNEPINTDDYKIPDYLDFTINANIREMNYEGMKMTNTSGILVIEEEQLLFENATLDMLDGKILANGKYDTKNRDLPFIDFYFKVDKFDLPKTFEEFVTVQKFAPIIEKSKGKYTTEFSIQSSLTDSLDLNYSTLNGVGSLLTHNINVENSGTLAQLAEKLNVASFKEIFLDNVAIMFKIENGRLEVNPFEIKSGASTAIVSGWNSFDQTIGYNLDVTVPTSELGGMAAGLTAMMGSFSGVAPTEITAGVEITGTIQEPKINVSIKDMVTDLKSGLKDKAKEELDKAKAEAERRAREELDKAKAEASERVRKQAEKLRADAKKQAERVKKEGKSLADKTRNEGYAAADKLISEAKNPVAKIAAKEAAKKLRSETDKKASKIENEANNRSDQILKQAEEQIKRLK
jgi:vacuolar-type H+-ATPase subunit H